MKKLKPFIEYLDEGDDYEPPIQEEVTQIIEIRLYCEHKGCKKYIKGNMGYNGAFHDETGKYADLRNQSWICSEHQPKKMNNYGIYI
jgi:hypothetical protein